jgi:DNA-binding MarR family transcriptional regulator
MTSQVLREQSVGVQAFGALLGAHVSATKQLNAQLVADHGLTISDYGVLLKLAWAPNRRLRRVDLAEAMSLSASGITRLLDGLERSGFVERAQCDYDRRVVYAVLTDEGLAKLREASVSHVEQVETLFGSRFHDDELEALIGLLGKFNDVRDSDCEPPA